MNWRSIAAEHAAERSAVLVHRDMARGLDGLATVAATAPFMGLLGTLNGIFGAFRGETGNRITVMAGIADALSQSLIPAALGLAMAILTSAAHHHLRASLADFDAEMHHAIHRLSKQLRRIPGAAI
jgi:biopolymer transport protein ExbB/TolQ